MNSGAMAREVLLRLAVRNFERVRDVVGQVAERAQRTLATARSISDEVRSGVERAQKSAEVRGRARASGGGGSSDGTLFDRGAFRVLGQVNQARERGEALGRTLFGSGETSQT